jgi:hypothetical protein
MTQIFFSYRRADERGPTSRILDYLVQAFGRDAIFYDVDTIPRRTDFREFIDQTIRNCRVVLVVISPAWLDSKDEYGRRLDQVNDPVRIEIETALRWRKRIIPVLIDDAAMPATAQLPGTIEQLASQSAAPMHNNHYFEQDVNTLINDIASMGVQRKVQGPIIDQSFARQAAPQSKYRPEGSSSFGDIAPTAAMPQPSTSTAQPVGAAAFMPAPGHVFISYKSGDRPAVSALASWLGERLFTVWFDQQLVGGQSWWDEILRNIRAADIFIFALTPAALHSLPCQLEYTYAHALGKRVLPVMLADGVDPRLLPPALQQIQLVDYREPEASGWPRLTAALGGLPPAGALPNPLPTPPSAPISPLGALKERIDATALSAQDQAYILVELKGLLAAPETADGALQLLHQFRSHPTLLAKYVDEITLLTAR